MRMKSWLTLMSILAASFVAAGADAQPDKKDAEAKAPPPQKKEAESKVTPITDEIVKKFKLDTTFYKKHLAY